MPNWPVEILQNKYTRWYEQIVLRAQSRTLPTGTYTETHHIIPRSLGGDDSYQNLAKLTAREHFICHWLLTKMINLENKYALYKMRHALHMMNAITRKQNRYSTPITSRVYQKLKSSWKMPPRTKEHSKNISESKKRNYASGKLIPWNKGKKRPPFSEEWCKKIGAANIGRKASKETCEKISKALKGIPRTEIWNKRNSLAKSRPVKTPEGCFIKYRLAVEHYMPIWDLRYGGADWRLRKLFDDPSNNEFTRISMEEYKKLIGENNA